MDTSEINIFFKDYAQAYLEFNADSLVRFFNFPSLIHDQAGIHFLKNGKELVLYERSFLENLKLFTGSVKHSESEFSCVFCSNSYWF